MQNSIRKVGPLFLAVALLLGAGGFVLGRMTLGSRPVAAGAGKAEEGRGKERHEGHVHQGSGVRGQGSGVRGEEAHAEEGVIKFDAESLEHAKLELQPVTFRPVPMRLAATGTVEPNLGGLVKITPRVVGKITAVRVNVGDSVGAGQTLATLASTDLAAAQAAHRQAGARTHLAQTNLRRQRQLADLGEFGRHKLEEARAVDVAAQGEVNRLQSETATVRNAVVEARSDLAAREGEMASERAEVASGASEIADAQTEVRTAQAGLAQAQSQVRLAEAKLNRTQRLQAAGISSRQQLEEARADHERAAADVDAARSRITQAEAKVETAKAHVQAAREKARAAQARVEEAQAKIETARSREKQVLASLATAEKRAEIAAQSLAREERVYKGGFFTSKELVEAEAAVRQAELEQDAAATSIRLLGGSPGGGSTIAVNAPIAGRVTERTVTLGETVDPAKTLFTILNLESVWVQLDVYQKDLPSIRVGQAVRVTSDTAPGRIFSGTVSYVGDLVDETTRTLKVRAVIQNVGNALKPQTFVRGTIATGVGAPSGGAPSGAWSRSRTIAVPREAVQTLEGKTVVFIKGDHAGEFMTREVKTGDTVGAQTEIVSGLNTGDQVVTRGAFMVKAQAMKSELGHSH